MKKTIASIRALSWPALIIVAIIFGAVGLALALPASQTLRSLSKNEYCASCHIMEPVVETFAHSSHGGNNDSGFVADCVSCHIPKSNVVEELWVKGTSGARHLWGEYVTGMTELDYDRLHDMRTEYVYDSGCLSCHKDIEPRAIAAAKQDTPTPADWTHAIAFEKMDGDSDWQCSSCHIDIAHPGLKWNLIDRKYDELREAAAGGNN